MGYRPIRCFSIFFSLFGSLSGPVSAARARYPPAWDSAQRVGEKCAKSVVFTRTHTSFPSVYPDRRPVRLRPQRSATHLPNRNVEQQGGGMLELQPQPAHNQKHSSKILHVCLHLHVIAMLPFKNKFPDRVEPWKDEIIKQEVSEGIGLLNLLSV